MLNLARYLPHSGDMVLIDEIVEVGEDYIITKSIIANHALFLENGAMPTYKSLEMMAQSLGVFRGIKESESKNKLGFLLGARRFEIFQSSISGEIVIKATLSMQDESGLGVYDCEVYCNLELVAKASISALNPSNDFLDNIKGKI